MPKAFSSDAFIFFKFSGAVAGFEFLKCQCSKKDASKIQPANERL
jgi:hypothetical protein